MYVWYPNEWKVRGTGEFNLVMNEGMYLRQRT